MPNSNVRHVEAAGDAVLNIGEQVRCASQVDNVRTSAVPFPIDPFWFTIWAGAKAVERLRNGAPAKHVSAGPRLVDQVSFRTRPILVVTTQRVLIITSTVRAHKARILYEWPHGAAAVTATTERFEDNHIWLFLADGSAKPLARHGGTKFREWAGCCQDVNVPKLVE